MTKITSQNLREIRNNLGLSQARFSEITGISQQILSGAELGKIELSKSHVDIIKKALLDKSNISRVAKREKRYQNHTYKSVTRVKAREQRARKTPGNEDYVETLNNLYSNYMKKNKCYNALSLFAGVGGFSLGFSAAGFNVKGYLEIDESLRKIYKLNFPNSLELGGDITEINDKQLSKFKGIIGDIDIIIGGPPCQGFSLSGKRDIEDPRNYLFKHYLRFVDIFKPKIAVVENVRLLTTMKSPSGRLVKDEIQEGFNKHGYNIKIFSVNAKEYGIPQHRERVFFIATRNDLKIQPTFPLPTHGINGDLLSIKASHRSFGDACSDLDFLESGESSDDQFHVAVNHPAHVIDWLWDVSEGMSAHDNEDPNKRPPSGYNTTYKRQIWNEPASTVQTTFGMISGCRNVHPIATRSLTIREASRIQSFPDNYKFAGSQGSIRTGIGNAVPPLLAYSIGITCRDLLNSIKVSRL